MSINQYTPCSAWTRLAITVLAFLGFPAWSFAQFSITGPTCVVPGTQYTYTIAGSWTNSTGMTWIANGGTINGSASGTPLPQIHITWSTTTTGSVQVSTTNPTGNASLSVTANDPLTGGTISNSSQSINYNTIPTTLSCSASTGGSCTPAWTYQWQSSPDNSVFTNITGATNQNLSFTQSITATTYYRRMVTETSSNSTAYSNSATVIVYPQLNGGSASPSSQTINFATPPALFSVSGVTGGSGTYSYQWQNSPDNSTWTNINLATSSTYQAPALGANTYYRVVVTSNGASQNSASAYVQVYPALLAGSVSPASTGIGYNTSPGQLSLTGVSGGSGTYTYQWQSSTTSSFTSPTTITGATLSTYTPGNLIATTYYRAAVTSNGVTNYATYTTVSVYPPLNPGTLSPATTTVNFEGSPGTITLSGVSGGSGTYSYDWQSSTDGVNWTAIPDAGDTTFYIVEGVSTTTYYRVQVSGGSGGTSATATVTVRPELFPGIIGPNNVSILSGGTPGLLSGNPATGGSCSGSYGYQWQSSTDGSTWNNVTNATNPTYLPGAISATTYYRRQVTCGSDIEYSNVSTIAVVTASDLNYIRTREIHKAGVMDSATAASLTSPYDVTEATQYFDGLGRASQAIAMQQSPLQKDMVSINDYDYFGREAHQFMPFADTSGTGNYHYTASVDQYNFNAAAYPNEAYYYSLSDIESSPLNRVLTNYPQGSSWVGSNRGVSGESMVNRASDSVRVWTIGYAVGSIPTTNSTYPAGSLIKSLTTDEAGHQVVSYTDFNGHVVLKKVQLASSPGTAHVGWLCTYYIYDDMGLLRFVIQPQAVVLINSNWSISSGIASELCFQYDYDQWGRMNIKKVPGAGEVHMVYDERDRLVMTQDSLLRAANQWLETEYDGENRPDSTVLMNDPTNAKNLAFHTAGAMSSATYPSLASYSFTLQTQTYYDNYAWVSGSGTSLSASMATTYTGNSNDFITSFNTSPAYALAMTAFPICRGMVTGSRKLVLGTSQYLYAVPFYDDHSRVIQSQSVNYTGGIDTLTTQFNFTGQPLRNMLSHAKLGNTAQRHTVVTKMDYDQAFRLRHIWKNIDAATADQLIDSMQYNEIGQLNAKYLGNNVDSLIYAYNVRGWLSGINPNYVAGTANHYFGMELGYDKTSSIAAGNTYVTPEYNGNIEGTVWKSAGSGINRKYDFTYDNVNRLAGAAFLQNTAGSTWDKATVDYSVTVLGYDANGNILNMTQQGFVVGGSSAIDNLTYNYISGTNKLSGVTDAANNPSSQLGDFHYNTSTKGSSDYAYDGNGNLTLDNNKAITAITYNYLNLPQLIHFQGKGNISYVYDAAGVKLAKVTIDTPANHSVRTLYLDGMVYQQTGTLANPGGVTDTLQFIGHEEGRARWAYHTYINGTKAYRMEYDFFEKDHLGNTRMVLTQERDTTNYLASMEFQYRSTESKLFGNIAATSAAWTSMPNYQNIPNNIRFGTTSPNDSVSKVDYNGTTGQTTGPSLLLKVMSGDTVTLGVQCYYASNSITTTNSSFNSVLNSMAAGIVGTPTGAAEGTLSGYTASSSPVYSAITSFLSSKDPAPPSGYPKAYLNWILLDDQFNYVSSSSGSVAAASSTYPAGQMNAVAPGSPVVMPRNGYLYVWVSNETQGWDVFFDNFSVQYKQGPVLEENHYYPFGLSMSGISDKAIKTNYSENKYRYNSGNELQNKEFSDGSGLETYDATHRMYDPQIGRFWRIDRFAEITHSYSPYAFVLDNPVLFNDPLGDTTTLPTAYVTAAKPGSLTYGLNHYDFAQTDAWVDFMLQHGHAPSQINSWALSNDLLNDDTRRWILNGTTAASIKYRKSMAASWKAQGKLYKLFLLSSLTVVGGEIVGVVSEGGEGSAAADEAVDATEGTEAAETSINSAEDILNDVKLDGKVLKNGELQGEIEGNPADIESSVAKDATQVGKGQYKLNDGTTVKFYQSTKGGGQSMQINTGDVIYKVRIK